MSAITKPVLLDETGKEIRNALQVIAEAIKSGAALDYAAYDLPVLELNGDVSAMTKDNAVTLNYVFGDRSGTCTCKWQGSSSLAYPKKNYTIKFDNAFEAVEGWGAQKKYCLKANFIDHSHARNVVSAKLWGQIVKTRKFLVDDFNINAITGAVGWDSVDRSQFVAVDDGVVTVLETNAGIGGVLFTGNPFAAGTYTVSFEAYAPANTDPEYRSFKLCAGVGGSFVKEEKIYNDNFEEWQSFTSEVTFTSDGSMIGMIGHVASGYKFRNISVVSDGDAVVYGVPELAVLPNGGAVDGFPCVVALNGEFHGLYTWNIPKDGWMFGMGGGETKTETEVLPFDTYANTIDVATGAYTPTTEVTGVLLKKKNTLMGGGRSYVTWDTSKVLNFSVRAYLFDANGQLSKVFSGNNGIVDNPYWGMTGGNFGMDAWLEPTSRADTITYLTEPFSIPVPQDHTIMWEFFIGDEIIFPDGTITKGWSDAAEANGTWVYKWMQNGIETSIATIIGTKEAIFCAGKESEATYFADLATLTDNFELEYVTDEDNADWALTSLNKLISACIDSDGTDLDTIGKYVDWDSAIDYYIFTCLLGGADMAAKNYLLATYDGTKWFFSAYDMDSTYGLWWDGKTFLNADFRPTIQWYAAHKLMNLILTHKKDELKSRYAELRASVMSEDNLAVMFENFAAEIPSPVLVEDVKKWPTIPSSAANNTAQILNWYRLRAKVIDAEVAAL